jgi:hypothetical protein
MHNWVDAITNILFGASQFLSESGYYQLLDRVEKFVKSEKKEIEDQCKV